MKLLLLLMLGLFKPAPYDVHLQEVKDYIDDYHNKAPKWRGKAASVKRAKEIIAPIVVKQSIEKNIDPLLTSIIITCESTWKPKSIGKMGEKGLMQVMRGNKEIEKNIYEGTSILEMGFKACKNTKEVLTYYASGSCKPRTETTKRKMNWRYKKYLKAVKKHRIKVNPIAVK